MLTFACFMCRKRSLWQLLSLSICLTKAAQACGTSGVHVVMLQRRSTVLPTLIWRPALVLRRSMNQGPQTLLCVPGKVKLQPRCLW